MNPMRSYQGKYFNDFFSIKSFFETLALRQEDESTFCLFFDGNEKKSEISFSHFFKVSTSLSNLLKVQFDEHDSVAVSMENSIEFMIASLAIIFSGKKLLILDPRQDYTFYKNIQDKFKCNCVVSETADEKYDSFLKKFLFSNYANIGLEKSFALNSLSFNNCERLVLFSSSGTTGLPKCIMHNLNSLYANIRGTIIEHQLNSSTTHVAVLPLFHVNAFNFSFLATLFSGGKLILNRNFSFPYFWSIANAHNANIISLIPPIIKILVDDPRTFHLNTSIQYAVSAASYLPKSLALDFLKKFKIPVFQAYGMSEAVNFSATIPTSLSIEDYRDLLGHDSRLPIGREFWGNNIYLISERGDFITDEDTEGELVFSGLNLMLGYANDTELTEQILKNNLLHSGDIGYFKLIHGVFYFYITGRKKEIIKLNGELVHLDEIESYFLETDEVEFFAFVTFQDFSNLEQLGLYIKLRQGAAQGGLVGEIGKFLPPRFFPAKIVFGNEKFETASGKKKRNEIVKNYFQAGRDA